MKLYNLFSFFEKIYPIFWPRFSIVWHVQVLASDLQSQAFCWRPDTTPLTLVPLMIHNPTGAPTMFRRVHSGALGDNNPGARVNQESIHGRYRRQLSYCRILGHTRNHMRDNIADCLVLQPTTAYNTRSSRSSEGGRGGGIHCNNE